MGLTPEVAMRRVILLSVLPVALVVGTAAAGPAPHKVHDIIRMATSFAVVPREWEGVWTVVDSDYSCEGALDRTGTDSPTVCAGTEFTVTSPTATYTCSGTWDATTLDMFCTGTGQPSSTCAATDTIWVKATLTGDTFLEVVTDHFAISGPECGIPETDCYLIRVHGTRTGPVPAGVCNPTTPTKRSTWGEIKVLYR